MRKAAIVCWTSIGLLVLTWRTLPNAWRRILDRSPRLQRLMDSLVLSNIAHRPARTAVSILGTGVGVLLIVFTVGLRTAFCTNVDGANQTSARRS